MHSRGALLSKHLYWAEKVGRGGRCPQAGPSPATRETWFMNSREGPGGQCSSQQPQVILFLGEG